MKFTLSRQADLEGRRIVWKARIAGVWEHGKAGTLWDAIEQIETRAALAIQ